MNPSVFCFCVYPGAMPYEGKTEEEVKMIVKQGQTLEKPADFPQNM